MSWNIRLRFGRFLAVAWFLCAFSAGAQPTSPSRAARVVGVYDLMTAEPVEGARVLDMLSKWSAQTTTTGTVALSFVDSVGSLITVSKIGYEPVTRFVTNARTDTTAVMFLLRPLGTVLPAAVTTGKSDRGPADTIRTLQLNGFYERRHSSAAPSSAFVMKEQIERLTVLSDLPHVNGRSVCESNVYINGAKVTVFHAATSARPGRRVIVRPPLHDGIDAIVLPDQVVGIEMYKGPEVPAAYGGTGSSCATLIWTK